MKRGAAGAIGFASLFIALVSVVGLRTPANAQSSNNSVGNWLSRQLFGSKGANSNNQPTYQNQYPQNQPVVGYNPSYYQAPSYQHAQIAADPPPGVNPGSVQYPRRQDPKKANQLIAQGDQLMSQGKNADASMILYEACLYDPNNANAVNDLGVSLANQNYTNQALEEFKIATYINPKLAVAYFNTGWEASNTYGLAPSVNYMTQAIRLDPSRASWWYWRSNDEVILGDLSDGSYGYAQAVKLDPKYAVAYCWKGILELRQRQDYQGHSDLQEALKLDPSLLPTISKAENSIMAARRQAEEIADAQARASERQSDIIAHYRSHARAIASVVNQGPAYYESVYQQDRRDGESASEARDNEYEAEDTYNKDVALQNAWEQGDYTEMDRINSGDADSSEIANYNADTSPTNESNSDSGGGGGDSDDSGGGGGGGGYEESAPADDGGGGGGGDDGD